MKTLNKEQVSEISGAIYHCVLEPSVELGIKDAESCRAACENSASSFYAIFHTSIPTRADFSIHAGKATACYKIHGSTKTKCVTAPAKVC